MSLIADALKAAQDEKRKRKLPPRAQQPHGSYFPLRGGGVPQRRSPAPIAVAVAVLLGAAAIATVIVARGRDSGQPFMAANADAAAVEFVETQIDTAVFIPGGQPAASATSTQPSAPERDEERAPPVRAGDPPRRPAPRPSEVAVADASARTPLVTDRAPAAAAPRTGLPAGLQITIDRTGASGAAALFQQALAAQRRREFVAARDLYLQVVYLDAHNAEAHNNLGAVYRELNDPRAAEASYRAAVQADARYAPAWSNLGALLGAQGRTREAIEALQRATQLDPANSGAKVNLAIQYRAAGLLTEAKRLLEEVLRADPSIAQAHYTLAQVLEAQGDARGASASYRLFLTMGAGQFPQLEEQVRRHLQALEATL